MIEDFLWWVAEKSWFHGICGCVSVCPSILAPGARTAGPIGTGVGSFDATERWKDDGANCKAICATLHVARASVPTISKYL